MFSITLQLMRKSLKMLIPAGLAILIGTAFITSTLLFSNAMSDSLKTQATAVYARATHIVSVGKIPEDLTPEETDRIYRRTVDDLHLDRMRAIDGVVGVRADAQPLTLEIGHDGKRGTVVVTSTSPDAKLLTVDVTEGTQPIDNGEIALPADLASRLGVRVGDEVKASSDASRGDGGTEGTPAARNLLVVGLTDDPTGIYGYYGGAGVLSDAELAHSLGAVTFGDVNPSSVYLDIEADKAAAATKEIRTLLPQYFTIQDRAAVDAEAIAQYDIGGTSITTVFLLGFGVIAMLVAALVIANTFQVLVAQRRRTLALLRTIGAKKGQLHRSVLLEACLLGLTASGLGIGTGAGFMAVACNGGLLEGMGLKARFIMTWPVIVVPLAFGVLVTVLASLSSARTATSVTPLEALRPIELAEGARRAGRVRLVLGALLVVGGAAMTVWALSWVHGAVDGGRNMDDGYSMVLLTAIAGCAFVFLGLTLTAVAWLPLLIKGFGWLVAHLGPSAAIAHANVQKNPRRVAATGAALLIGVTLVSTIATGAASAKETMGDALATRYSVDMIVSGDLDQATADKIAAVDGIEGSVYAPVAVGGFTDAKGQDRSALFVGVTGTDELGRVVRADLDGARVNRSTALFPTYSALNGKRFDLTGGTVDVRIGAAAATGSAEASTDAGTSDGNASGTKLSLTVTQADYRRVSDAYDAVAFVSDELFADGGFATDGHMLLLRVDGEAGRSANDIYGDIQQIIADVPGVSLGGPIAGRMQWESTIDSMMLLLVALLAVAVFIALIGVANTLSLSVIERTRESATLRAIGMTRGQLRRSLAVEALLISMVAGLSGVVMGTLFGWAGAYMVFSFYGAVAFPVEWGMDAAVLGVAALAALLASVFPARRAVRTPPVEALAEA